MSVVEALNHIMRIAFILITAITFLDYLRVRTRKRLDIHLMFLSIGLIMLIQLLSQATGLNIRWLNTVSLLAFLAHPYLLLSLTAHLRPLSATIRWTSLGGLLLSWGLYVLIPAPLPIISTLVIVAYFALVEGYAAWSFVQGATMEGIAQRRFLLAAAGSGCLALVLLLLGFAVIVPSPEVENISAILIPGLAIASALAYYIGFVPPMWLRQSWQLRELYRFQGELSKHRSDDDREDVFQTLCMSAIRSVGGQAAAVAIPEEDHNQVTVRTATDSRLLAWTGSVHDGVLGRVWGMGRPYFASKGSGVSANELDLMAACGTRALLCVPIASPQQSWGLLLVFTSGEPLFPQDDLRLLSLFAEQVAIMLAHHDLLAEQRQLVIRARQSNAELARATRLKSEFLANMSHELRTPLNAIIGFAELMHDGKVGAVSPVHQEYLGDILTSARHLLQLINDVLDLSKIEAGKMDFHPEPVNLSKVVGEVTDILRALAAQKRIHVETEVDEKIADVVTDPGKLKQVLYNYLSNALKFTPDEGRVTVRVLPEGDKYFRLEVDDSGIGIAPEDQSRLFQEFQQLDAGTSKRYQGTGLGLALTKRIVEAQDGHVGVLSKPGEGSRFYAAVPRQPLKGPDREVQTTRGDQGKGRHHAPTVLVVEDDQKDRAWLSNLLSEHGYSVEAVSDGTEAVCRCTERVYDAIILDLLLPDMSGLDVLREVRTGTLNRDIPVILATVVAERGTITAFPIHDHLVKPLRPESLLDSLKRAGVWPHRLAKVLVVDDDAASLKLMAATLTQVGYQPVCSNGGAEGLAAAEEHRPAAIVLDLMMPEVDGFEFLSRFRQTPHGLSTPVIIWTAKELTDEDREYLKGAVQSVVLKRDGRMDTMLDELERQLKFRRRPLGAS